MPVLEAKWLTGQDLEEIDPIIEAEGWTRIPVTSMVYALYDEKGIAGFHVLQMRAHAEPLWVRPDMRGTKIALDLATEVEGMITDMGVGGFIVVADTPEAEKLCERFGMRKIESPVYIR